MHLSSLEVRWFWIGELDKHPRLRATFENFSTVVKRSDVTNIRWSKPREDVYIVIPSADDLGIKWREGELQTKGRRSLLGNMLFGDHISGIVEQWIKWTHGGSEVDASFQPVFSAGTKTTITVWKRRALRKIRLDPFGRAEEVPELEHIDRGMNCELTDLKVKDSQYCSLAFEAFPDDSEMPEQFAAVVSGFLASFDSAAFDGAESRSYPAWLNRLASIVSGSVVAWAGGLCLG
jgi:hypothetical protein